MILQSVPYDREVAQVNGQTDAMSSMPYDLHSSTMAWGSGQYSGSNDQSPMTFQWNQSITRTPTLSRCAWK